MNYNLHPIIVHFPIAFLFVYSVIKILPFKKWFPRVAWRHIEQIVLLVGVLGAFAAQSTGEPAQHLMHADRKLVYMHAFFGGASIWMYGLILAGEILFIINPYVARLNIGPLTSLLRFFEKILTDNFLSKALAFLGFIAIFLTGLLGGIIVYGTTADPIAPIVLKLLGISI